ncbi:uncharacterized protein ACRADG_010235 [Cochliomyia hominivorax]
MLSLVKLLLQIIQCLSIIFGYNFVYIDVKKGLVKIYKIVKIYVYTFYLLFGGILLCYCFDRYVIHAYYTVRLVIIKATTIFAFLLDIFLFFAFIVMRIKEEKYLKKFHKIVLNLQGTYFNKLREIPINKTIRYVLILNVFLIMAYSIYTVLKVVIRVIKVASNIWHWLILLNVFHSLYFTIAEHHILLRHGLILCYINDYFTKFNSDLKYTPVNRVHVRVYQQLYFMLKEINNINGPLIFCIILSHLLKYAKSIYNVIFLLKNRLDSKHIWLYIGFGFGVHLFLLYFLICENIKITANETGEILRKYREKENQMKIETICFGRLLMKPEVSICNFFTINFSCLFGLISQIIMLAIIITQSSYY